MKIHIWEDYSNARICLIGEVNYGDKLKLVGFNGKNLVYQDYDPASPMNPKIIPLLQFSMLDKNDIFKSLLDALSDRNIKTENENHLKGELDATKLHLQDMREMTKQLIQRCKTLH